MQTVYGKLSDSNECHNENNYQVSSFYYTAYMVNTVNRHSTPEINVMGVIRHFIQLIPKSTCLILSENVLFDLIAYGFNQ